MHPKYRTPILAITVQAVWASFLVLCGNLQQLVSYTGFAVVLFAGVAVMALMERRLLQASSGAALAASERRLTRLAIASLVIWAAAIAVGRLVAYTF